MSNKKTMVFVNSRKVPDVNNVIHDRIELYVSSAGIPIDQYWRKRFNESAIAVENKSSVKKKETPVSKPSSDKEVNKDAN